MTTTAVVFDVGNVLYGWDPESFLVRQIVDDEARLKFIEDVDLLDEAHACVVVSDLADEKGIGIPPVKDVADVEDDSGRGRRRSAGHRSIRHAELVSASMADAARRPRRIAVRCPNMDPETSSG